MALTGRLATQQKSTGFTGRLKAPEITKTTVKQPSSSSPTFENVRASKNRAFKDRPLDVMRQDTLAPLPEKKPPLGFLGAMVKTAYETVKGTFEHASKQMLGLQEALMSPAEGSADLERIRQNPLAPEYMKQGTTPLKRGVKMATTAVSTLPFAVPQLLQFSVELEAAKKLPGVLSVPAKIAGGILDDMGRLGTYTLSKGIEVFPKETQESLHPLADELGPLIAQMVGMKVLHKSATEGLKLKELPVTETTKQKISNAGRMLTGFSMAPFSTAYSMASARLAFKVEERQKQGIEITPEVGRQLIEEMKREIATEPMPEVLPPLTSEPVVKMPRELKVEEAAVKSQSQLPAAEQIKSRVFERMKVEHPELEGELTADVVRLKVDAERAIDLIAKDKQKAYDIAMGKEVSGDILQTSANIALAEKALSEGNNQLFADLVKKRSLDQTRRGQEIVAEKGSITDNSTSRYVKELISARLEALGDKYLSDRKAHV